MKLQPHQAVYAWNIIEEFCYDTGAQAQFGLPENKAVKKPASVEPKNGLTKLEQLLSPQGGPAEGLDTHPSEVGVPVRALLSGEEVDRWEFSIAEDIAYKHSDERGFASFPKPPMDTVVLTDEQKAELVKRFQKEGITETSLAGSGVLEGNSLHWSALHAKAQEFTAGREFGYYS